MSISDNKPRAIVIPGAKNGRFPKVEIRIQSLDTNKTYKFDKFISYNFQSSIIVPVDSFSFTFSAPDAKDPFTNIVQPGDIVTLWCNDVLIATGIADQLIVEVDGDQGERVTVNGRDMFGQLEDQNCVTLDSKPIWGENIQVASAIKKIIEGTRISKVIEQSTPKFKSLLRTEPAESKLNAILRIIEPVNCLVWSDATGAITVGKPNQTQKAKGKLTCNKAKRESNVLSMRAVRSDTSIPGIYVGLWSDIQQSSGELKSGKIKKNALESSKRLVQGGHITTRAVITSLPNGDDPASFDSATRLNVAQNSKNSDVLDYFIDRQIARDNFNELLVAALIPGHLNEGSEAYKPDQVYLVDFDRAGINENMYLYSVVWNFNAQQGQWTELNFCRFGTIVADIPTV